MIVPMTRVRETVNCKTTNTLRGKGGVAACFERAFQDLDGSEAGEVEGGSSCRRGGP